MEVVNKIKSKIYSLLEPKRNSNNSLENFIKQANYNPDLPAMKSRGTYPLGYPEGLVVHYTAGNSNQLPESAISMANKNGHLYFFIDEQGNLHQQFSFEQWGYHAGESVCPVTKRKSVSRFYAGVEIANSGILSSSGGKYFTWFGKEIPKEKVRVFNSNDTQKIGGVFEKFSPEQEMALFSLCMFFVVNYHINPQLILGHDEVSPFRKADPGGSLTCSMRKFRAAIEREYASSRDLSF